MINKVIILGNVGKDPELKHSSGGLAMVSISVATSKKYTDNTGAKQNKTTWHFCKFFGKKAEVVAQYVKKGSQLYVEGEMSIDTYTDKSGVEKQSASVIVQDFQMLGGRTQDGTNHSEEAIF